MLCPPPQVPGSDAGLQVHGHRVPGHAGLEAAEDQRVQPGEDRGGAVVTRTAPPPQPFHWLVVTLAVVTLAVVTLAVVTLAGVTLAGVTLIGVPLSVATLAVATLCPSVPPVWMLI